MKENRRDIVVTTKEAKKVYYFFSKIHSPSTITMKVVISVTLDIRKADIEVAFLASAAFTITLIIGIRGSSMRGIWGGKVLLMNSTDSTSEMYRGRLL